MEEVGPIDRSFLKGYLYCFLRHNLNVDACEHELSQLTHGQVYTKDEIINLYEKIQEKMEGSGLATSVSQDNYNLNIGTNPAGMVVKKMDKWEQTQLLKISTKLERFMKLTPYLNLQNLQISINPQEIRVENEKSEIFAIFRARKEQVLCKQEFRKIPKKLDILNEEFEFLLENSHKYIEKLEICADSEENSRRNYVFYMEDEQIIRIQDQNNPFETLNSIFESRGMKIKVRQLYMHFYGIQELFGVLPFLEPRTLKVLNLYFDDNQRIYDDFSAVFELDQWKYAREFISDSEIFIWEHLEHFLHFRYLNIRFHGETTRENLNYLKNALTSKNDLVEWRINLTSDTPENRQTIRSFYRRQGGIYRNRHEPRPFIIYDTGNRVPTEMMLSYEIIWFKGPLYKLRLREKEEQEFPVLGTLRRRRRRVEEEEDEQPGSWNLQCVIL
ncbi:unnamed protein product [Caenorhabditis nigoni]